MSGNTQYEEAFFILLRKPTSKTFANRSLFFLGRSVGISRTKKPTKTNNLKPWEEGVELRKQRGKY